MRTSSTGLSSAATFTRPILCTEEKTSSQYIVLGILGCALQPRTDFHPALDSSKNSVFPIQPGCRRKCNEELTACRAKDSRQYIVSDIMLGCTSTVRVRSTVGHAQDASTGVLQVRADLVFELLSIDRSAAATSASRVTALNHEVRDNAVEDGAIVVIARGER